MGCNVHIGLLGKVYASENLHVCFLRIVNCEVAVDILIFSGPSGPDRGNRWKYAYYKIATDCLRGKTYIWASRLQN